MDYSQMVARIKLAARTPHTTAIIRQALNDAVTLANHLTSAHAYVGMDVQDLRDRLATATTQARLYSQQLASAETQVAQHRESAEKLAEQLSECQSELAECKNKIKVLNMQVGLLTKPLPPSRRLNICSSCGLKKVLVARKKCKRCYERFRNQNNAAMCVDCLQPTKGIRARRCRLCHTIFLHKVTNSKHKGVEVLHPDKE